MILYEVVFAFVVRFNLQISAPPDFAVFILVLEISNGTWDEFKNLALSTSAVSERSVHDVYTYTPTK
jgi:hypothetical protein